MQNWSGHKNWKFKIASESGADSQMNLGMQRLSKTVAQFLSADLEF